MQPSSLLPDARRKSFAPLIIVSCIVIAAFCIIAGTYLHYRLLYITQEKRNELTAIADLKVGQIEQWRAQWISHGNVIMHDPILRKELERWFHARSNPDLTNAISAWMDLQKNNVPFLEVHICDSLGVKWLSSMAIAKPMPSAMAPFIQNAWRTGTIQLTDFHLRASDNRIHLDMIVPIRDSSQGRRGRGTLCLAVFTIDPQPYLFPLIQSWPTPSTTSETLIFRREGNEVVYLNELRHKKNSALTLRLPIDKKDLPAALAVKGKEGIFEGVDYRGAPVLACARPIAGSPWFLIAKIDKTELSAPLHRVFFITFTMLFGLIVFTVMAVFTIEHSRSSKHYRTLYAEQQKTKDQLAAQREQLAVTLRSIGDGVISTDNTGRILLMNRVAETMTGWPLCEAEGKPLTEVFCIINEMTGKPFENPVEKVLKTGSIISLENYTVLISRDGRKIVIADSGAPIKDKDSNTVGVVLVFRDATDKQKAVENMIKTEKLESIGLLAGGIAHDFNNLLGGIFGYVDLAREMAAGNETIIAPLSKALKVFNRARDLTRQLLTFSKGGAPSKKNTPMGPLITEMAHFALSGSNVRCSFSIPDDLWSCNVDENQISQVIDNIVINAQQAMPQGGEIVLSAENVTVQNQRVIPLPQGKYVKISIRDQGVGIPRDHMRKIFDPFFTTKQKGSGLGLATSFSIVQKHDGFIDVESELGKGTTFILYLPAHETAVAVEQQSSIKHLKASGRILVMDDEDFIREVVQEMLVRMGYEVLLSNCGEDAIALVKAGVETNTPIHAAILDLTVPGHMGGKEAVNALLSIDPRVKTIASSGYSEDPVMANPSGFGFIATIKKPYLKEELAEVLFKVLNNAG